MARKYSTKKSVYATIDQITRGICHELGEGVERYEQYLHWALKAHGDWHMDQAREVKTVICELNSYKAIAWPVDYVDWTKVGIKCNNQILTFVNDDFMSFPMDKDADNVPDVDPECVEITDETDITTNGWAINGQGYYYYNLFNEKGQDQGKLWGLTAKDNYMGYFRVNSEREEIQFRSRFTNLTQVYLEYISDGYEPCKETLVHPYAASLIAYFVHWQRLKHTKPYIRGQVNDAKGDYWEEHDRVNGRQFNLTVEDILDAHRDGYYLIPRT